MVYYQELLNTCIDIQETQQKAEDRKRTQEILQNNLKQLSLNIDKFN